MGDDGLGISVIEQLCQQQIPSGIDLIDGGCGGITLLQLLEECDRALIIDAADFGQEPGAIQRLPADEVIGLHDETTQVSLHQTGLAEVLKLASELNQMPELTLFLVQPLSIERRIGLSQPVQKALPRLIAILQDEFQLWQRNCE